MSTEELLNQIIESMRNVQRRVERDVELAPGVLAIEVMPGGYWLLYFDSTQYRANGRRGYTNTGDRSTNLGMISESWTTFDNLCYDRNNYLLRLDGGDIAWE